MGLSVSVSVTLWYCVKTWHHTTNAKRYLKDSGLLVPNDLAKFIRNHPDGKAKAVGVG